MKRAKRPAPPVGGWGERWIELLVAFGWGARRPRTRDASPRVHDLAIGPRGLSARLRDGRGMTAEPEIALEHLPREVWHKAIDAMARKASFAASLLSGRMPADIETAFDGTGRRLIPETPREVRQGCTCGEEPFPCRHVLSLHELLRERLDRDPFLIFLLRGLDRETLLKELRRHRRAATSTPAPRREREVPATRLEPLPDVKPELFFRPLSPLASLRAPFAPSASADVVLARLGPPPLEDPDAARLLAELHRAIGLGAKEKLSEWEWRRS